MPELVPHTNGTKLTARLRTEIETAHTQHRVTPETMFLVEALNEIERLNEAMTVMGRRIESLFEFINELKGEKVAILRNVPKESRTG